MRALAVMIAALILSACATRTPPSAQTAQFAADSQACAQRGGAFVPSFGSGEYRCQSLLQRVDYGRPSPSTAY